LYYLYSSVVFGNSYNSDIFNTVIHAVYFFYFILGLHTVGRTISTLQYRDDSQFKKTR